MKLTLDEVCKFIASCNHKKLLVLKDAVRNAQLSLARNIGIGSYAKFPLKDGSILYGRVLSCTPKRLKLEITRVKGYPRRRGATIGTIWTVEPTLVTAVDEEFALQK